jgi:cytochrome c
VVRRHHIGRLALVWLGLPLLLAAQSGDATAGKDVFEGQCWDCHNTTSPEKKLGPSLKGVKDGKLPSGKAATREVLLQIINKGAAEMPPFEKTMNEKQKEDVIAYVLTL